MKQVLANSYQSSITLIHTKIRKTVRSNNEKDYKDHIILLKITDTKNYEHNLAN
jgi:hypothetical protein